MNNMLKNLAFIPVLLLVVHAGWAQVSPEAKKYASADSMKSGNTKDILTGFFQFALQDLIGKNKEFTFNSNPYAIMLKRNPRLSLDKDYTKYTPLRRLNINLGIRLDSSFGFNGFTSGLKYSLIDQTDFTMSKMVANALQNDPLGLERDILTTALNDYLQQKITDSAEMVNFVLNVDTFMRQGVPLNKMDEGFQNIVQGIVNNKSLTAISDLINRNPGKNFKTADSIYFAKLKNDIKKNLLWTIGISDSTYKDKFRFAGVAIVTELSRGIFNPGPGDNNLEVNLKAAYNFMNDSLQKQRNLKREILAVESGINWVLRDKTTDRPFCEIKFSGSYYHNFGRLYSGENRDSLTINGTLRIRVLEDIWIPLEIKYAPKTGNIFGILNIRANMTGLSKLLKS